MCVADITIRPFLSCRLPFIAQKSITDLEGRGARLNFVDARHILVTTGGFTGRHRAIVFSYYKAPASQISLVHHT